MFLRKLRRNEFAHTKYIGQRLIIPRDSIPSRRPHPYVLISQFEEFKYPLFERRHG